MRNRILFYWNFIRTSLWFVPAVMSIAAIMLAILLLSVGVGLVGDPDKYWFLYNGDAENARNLLSSLLSGMITMTSLVISITMVVLTLAAGQMGPRLIRNFIGDPQTQIVLGLFIATILYLLVVFRTIGGDFDAETVPHMAVTAGTMLSALCLFVLVSVWKQSCRSNRSDHAKNTSQQEK